MIDPITLSIITGLATGYFANLTTPAVQRAFQQAIELQPALAEKVRAVGNDPSSRGVEDLFREVTGLIDAAAGTGSIEVDGAVLEALRGIRFDHQDGKVSIGGGAWVSAPVLAFGGTGSGVTRIGASTLQAAGARAQVTGNASITTTGNAKLKIT